jgi:hypothetical protein
VKVINGIDEAYGASPEKGWISGSSFSFDRPRYTSGVFDPFTGDPVWITHDLHALIFSPDGEQVLGVDYAWDPVELAILDSATGVAGTHVKFEGNARRLPVWDVAWEDDTHVLAVVQDRRTWSLVRLGVDGTIELALPQELEAGPPFYLPADGSPF